MDDILQRDQNHVTIIGGVTDDVHQYIRPFLTDPITGRLLVSAVVAGSQNGKILVDAADTLYDYLANKLVSSNGSIQYVIENVGAHELLSLTVNATNITAGILPLAVGGTGADLTAPSSNAILGYDHTDGQAAFFNIGSGLIYTHSTHTLSSTGGASGVISVNSDGSGVVAVDNTIPTAPVIDFLGVKVDGVTITGNGTTASPLTASAGSAYSTIETNGTPLAQHATMNFSTLFTVTNNVPNSRTDIDINVANLATNSTFITDLTSNSTFLSDIANSSVFISDLTSNSSFITDIHTIVTTGGGLLLQTNTVNNSSQATLNLESTASIAVTNTSGGIVTFGIIAPVSVANGGTGLTAITAHELIVGNGTSTPNLVSPGTSGQVLTSNGASADPTFQSAGGGAGTGANQNFYRFAPYLPSGYSNFHLFTDNTQKNPPFIFQFASVTSSLSTQCAVFRYTNYNGGIGSATTFITLTAPTNYAFGPYMYDACYANGNIYIPMSHVTTAKLAFFVLNGTTGAGIGVTNDTITIATITNSAHIPVAVNAVGNTIYVADMFWNSIGQAVDPIQFTEIAVSGTTATVGSQFSGSTGVTYTASMGLLKFTSSNELGVYDYANSSGPTANENFRFFTLSGTSATLVSSYGNIPHSVDPTGANTANALGVIQMPNGFGDAMYIDYKSTGGTAMIPAEIVASLLPEAALI